MKLTEIEIASKVVGHLRGLHFDVYQEVLGPYGAVCDIVGKLGRIIVTVECKTSFGLAVLDQAFKWKNHAHYSYVAVPWRRYGFGGIAKKICLDYGIGLFVIRGGDVEEEIKPGLNRFKGCTFELHEEQKNFCKAGSANGGYWTPFKRTVRALIGIVEEEPGIHFPELISRLDHHYSSNGTAKSCLRKYIDTDIIPELETKMVGRKLCVFLVEPGAT